MKLGKCWRSWRRSWGFVLHNQRKEFTPSRALREGEVWQAKHWDQSASVIMVNCAICDSSFADHDYEARTRAILKLRRKQSRNRNPRDLKSNAKQSHTSIHFPISCSQHSPSSPQFLDKPSSSHLEDTRAFATAEIYYLKQVSFFQ